MRYITLIGALAAPTLLGYALCTASASDLQNAVEYVGSTPGGPLVQEFLGGLATNAECHCVVWQLKLTPDRSGGAYSVVSQYRVPTPGNTNLSEDGPRVTFKGTWEVLKSAEREPAVYQLNAENPRRSLRLVKVDENLLHMRDADGGLAAGNGGWSYTLNRADKAEKPVEASLARSAPDMSYKIAPLATGPTVFAVFEGRSPCHGISAELKRTQHAGCSKAKWRVTLYQDAATSAPTRYKVEGTLYRRTAREGAWSTTRGTKADANATVYQLDATETEPALLLWKADEHVLFFLNKNREPLVGHAEFSYTLNRLPPK